MRVNAASPQSTGSDALLVAKPMPYVTASSTPRNSATSASSSACSGVWPPSERLLQVLTPHSAIVPSTRGVQYASAAANPR